MLYWWSKEFSTVAISDEAGVSTPRVSLWFSIFKICANQMLSETEPVGGAGHVVKIDESKFGKRKYKQTSGWPGWRLGVWRSKSGSKRILFHEENCF